MKLSFSIPFLILCITLSGCALLLNPYVTIKDDFKNITKSTFEIPALPNGYLSPVIKADMIFERITTDKNEVANVYFVISRSSSSFDIEKKCYIKVDSLNYELPVEKNDTEYKSRQESTSTTTTVKDSTKIKTELTSKTDSFNWFDDKLVVRLTPGIKNALLKSNELTFRFYFGPKEGTFIFKGYALKKIKGLFVI